MILYDSDKIVELFRQAKLLARDEVIDNVIKTNTNYRIGTRYVVIYQSALYIAQLLILDDQVTSYILLKGTGNLVSTPIMDEITKLDTILKTLTRLDLKIVQKVTLSLLDLKEKTLNEISNEIQETVHDVSVALGDLQLQEIIQSDEKGFTVNIDIPTLTVLTERFATDQSRFRFMGSPYIERVINNDFVDYVIGRFFLPADGIKETIKTSAKIFPSVLRFLLLGDNTTYHYFYDRKQEFMSRPDAYQFNDMILSMFFRIIYEDILNDLRNTPPSYLKQKQIYGYSNAFDLKFGSQFDLILRVAAKMYTSIIDKGKGEIKAGEIMSPVNISSNLALGNHLLAIQEYNSAIETYDIIIENSDDDELLSMSWNNKSQCFRMMGQHEPELECIEKSLQHKIIREALSNKILCLKDLNREDEIPEVQRQLENLT